MELPPQPPPDVPAPLPGPEALRSKRKMNGILWLGWISVLGVVVLFTLPFLLRKDYRGADHHEARSNIKQIGLCLFDFDNDYGRFPDAATIPAVKAATSTPLALGSSSSNELFRQLFAAGLKSEKIFWAKTSTTPFKPNDLLGADTLVPGECAFTYIAGLSSASDPNTPIVMVPAIRGTWKFDRKPFRKKAAVLFIDGSVRTLPIDKNGEVILNGMNLFDPRQPYWHGKAPDIKWPE